ncbi:hypothetical protein PRZ48_006069 [Zasmidium cellare]|uniref:VASt domain-containing protein n=1 Tax=Zasmidium cellare TaxID=395010 RepID=A0ABR0EPA8_ZASCE|nr:hypothetical protein PRZ48_006069 [Zasmidium cellare]
MADVGTPSPRGVSKLRRLKDKGIGNVSTTSLPGTSGESDDSPANGTDKEGLRASMENAIDKVRGSSRRRSVDDRSKTEDGQPRKLSTLVSRAKRKVRKGDREGDLSQTTSRESGTDLVLPGNRSESSLFDESGHSSLLTDDERTDGNGKPIRPSLSPHQSHAGYLTFSSPEINAQTSSLVPGSDIVTSPEAVSTADPLANTNIPQIVEPHDRGYQSPVPPIPDRSPSPSNKLRGPFTLSRKKSSDDTAKSSTGGSGGLGGLFKSSSRRNSLSKGSGSDSQKKADQVNTGPEDEELQDSASQDRPQTPKPRGRPIDTSIPLTPPNLIETPTTLVTPPTPTDASISTFLRDPKSPQRPSSSRTLNSVESIKHRRAQSANLPSKLSTSINAPLTPTVEETKTPGGTLTQPPNSASGFFSSVFSAAQKASNSFGNFNSFTSQNQKSKPISSVQSGTEGGEEVIPGVESRPATGAGEEKKQLAVETLGKGNLSLSHLGISEAPETSPMSSTTELQQNGQPEGDQARKAEEEAAARAVSSAYEKPIAAVVSQATGRPSSIASNERLTLNGDQTPPRPLNEPDSNLSGMKRSGSVRSKLSGRRKHRGSSATAGTSNSIAAALRDTTTGLANPAVHGIGHRLTGFAVASSKRNKEFHQLFRSVPEDDYLIEDYSAALQRDILLHGRLYVSEGHVCFSSNILGWVTNLVISFDEIVSVEKKSTAVIFPNALVISTLHARNTFASFVARDSTYELLIGIWKISHPNLKSSLNGVTLDDAGTGDKTEVAEPEGSEEDTDEGTEDEVYDEDADDDAGSFTDGGMAASLAGSEGGDLSLSRKTSAAPLSSPPTNGLGSRGLESADAVVTAAALSSEFPGAPTHEPTQCTESAEHYDRPLTDTTIPAPLGKVYSMMFGPASGAFMKKWLVEDQKSRDLNYTDDKTGLDNDHREFTFDYIKPINAPVGPKQTKCITTNTLKAFDLEKSVSVDCSTSTPDVPSGNVFTVKTRYCLMWGPSNSTRMIATCTVEWTGKSWLKGPIEKGAEQGQQDYIKAITASLKAAVTTKPPVKGLPRKGKRKGKPGPVFDAEEAVTQREAQIEQDKLAKKWGFLEPVHQIVGPIIDIVRPFITSQVVIAVLFVLLAYTWLVGGRGPTSGVAYPGYTSPERIAAYEEIWRREESALWEWLEDRTGLTDGVPLGAGVRHREQQKVIARKLNEDESMSERQIDEQIRTTEEKLAGLKEAVERRRGKNKAA